MRWRTAITGISLILASCTSGTPDSVAITTTTLSSTTTRAPSNEICLAGDLPFSDNGLIAALGDDVGDASTITKIRWDPSATCERLTVTFGAGSGAPAATLGPTGVSVISYAGVVRIALPTEIVGTGIADTLLEGSLIHSAYVVREQDMLSIDIHGVDGIPITARAFTTTSPASLIIDVARSATDAAPVGVTATSAAVVVSPTPGPSEYPIVVEGYIAPGFKSIHIQLLESGEPVANTSMALDGDTDTWQHFTSTIDDGPIGAAVVFVGTVDGNGRADAGAVVSVAME
jgi:hypothetical protein